jgi:hypothetical protein
LRPRGKAKQSLLATGEVLEIDWTPWLDGRAHRLTRKRHFPDIDPDIAAAAAEAAAVELGKAVATSKDRFVPERYFWLQFADHKVGPGEPCPCGSRRLVRLHSNFARCPQCDAQLLLSDEIEDAGDPKVRGRAVRTLRRVANVRLERRTRTSKRELYRGYGFQDGAPVLLFVEFSVEDEPLTATNAPDRVVATRVIRLSELDGLMGVASVGVASLWGEHEPQWDLVL